MNSCAASCCTCSPQASCASATSASWPTADAPCRCRSACSYCLLGPRRRPAKALAPPRVRKIFGAVQNVLVPWRSSNDSLSPKSNFAPHLFWSGLPHETTIDSASVSGVWGPTVLLRLLAQPIVASRSSRSGTLRKLASPTTIPLFMPPDVRPCADPAQLHNASPPHAIPIGPRPPPGGFVQTALSKARPSTWPSLQPCRKARFR